MAAKQQYNGKLYIDGVFAGFVVKAELVDDISADAGTDATNLVVETLPLADSTLRIGRGVYRGDEYLGTLADYVGAAGRRFIESIRRKWGRPVISTDHPPGTSPADVSEPSRKDAPMNVNDIKYGERVFFWSYGLGNNVEETEPLTGPVTNVALNSSGGFQISIDGNRWNRPLSEVFTSRDAARTAHGLALISKCLATAEKARVLLAAPAQAAINSLADVVNRPTAGGAAPSRIINEVAAQSGVAVGAGLN